MNQSITILVADDSGATLVEYGLLLLLIAIVAIGALTFLGGGVTSLYSNVANDI